MKNVLSLIGGVLITGVILMIVFFAYFILTLRLFGGERLSQVENEITILVITLAVLAALAVRFSLKKLKKGKKYLAFGVSFLPIIAFVITTIFYLGMYTYPTTTFNKEKWQKEELKPFKMAATLAKKDKLIDLSREEVFKLLGKEDGGVENQSNHIDNGSIFYLLDKKDWVLKIFFKEDKVVECVVELPIADWL